MSPRRPRVNLSTEDEHKILDLYAHSDKSIKQIADILGVTSTYPYRTLDRLGVGWRRGAAETFDAWAARTHWPHHDPEPVETPEAERPEVREPDSIHPGRAIPPPVSFTLVDVAERWTIDVTERFDVSASTIDEALSAAHQLRPGARVTSVKLKG
jgi:transposase-like protein